MIAGLTPRPALPDEPAGATARPAAIERTLHLDARYAAHPRATVRYVARAYRGPLEVDAVLTAAGTVADGQPLLRLSAPDLAQAIEKATLKLDEAREALTAAELKHAQALELVHVKHRGLENSARYAAKNLAWWQSGGANDARVDNRVGVESSQARLDDEAQELAQLEALYATANLESDTRDIVLQRARRQLKINRDRHAVAARRAQQQLDVNLPKRDQEFENTAESTQRALDHALANATVDAAKRDRTLARAHAAAEDARQALADLEADREALRLTADAAGWMTRINLQPGDPVKNRADLADIEDPAAGYVDVDLAPDQRDLLPAGSDCTVRVPALGGVAAPGTVAYVSGHARREGNGSRFTARVHITAAPTGLRPGMRVVVTAPPHVAEAGPVVVPQKLVYPTDDGGFRVFVRADGAHEARAVVLGLAGAGMVQVRTGLQAGEHVMPEPPETDGPAAPAPPTVE